MKGTVIIERRGRDFEVAHRVEAGEHHIEVAVGSSFNELYWDFSASKFVAHPDLYEELPEVLRQYHAAWLLPLIPQLAARTTQLSSEQLREIAGTESAILDILADATMSETPIDTVARWTEALVIHMKQPLDATTRTGLRRKFPGLRYFQSAGSPQNSADEGFIDDEAAAAISFPLLRA